MSGLCVYRYMIGDEWIYVGKAERTLDARIRAHAKEERFLPYIEKCEISYIEFNHVSDMEHAEAALIKIKKPRLNIALKNEDVFPFLLDDSMLTWKKYANIKEQMKELKRIEFELKKKKKEKEKIHRELEQMKEWHSLHERIAIRDAGKEWTEFVIDGINAAVCGNDDVYDTIAPYYDGILTRDKTLSDTMQNLASMCCEENGGYRVTIHKNHYIEAAIALQTWCRQLPRVSGFMDYRADEIQRHYGLSGEKMFGKYEETKLNYARVEASIKRLEILMEELGPQLIRAASA